MPEYSEIKELGDVPKYEGFNWGSVIGDVRESLLKSEAKRQADRDLQAKETNEALNTASKVTLGKDEDNNKKIMDFVYNIKSAVAESNRLVQQNKKSMKDDKLFRDNVINTFNTINSFGANAKAAFDSYTEQSKLGNLSGVSDTLAGWYGNAASLKNSELIFDKEGRGFISGFAKDGTPSKNPADMVEINWLNNEKNLLVPKVKLDAELDAQADKLAEFTKRFSTTNGIWTVTDLTQNKSYLEFEENITNGLNSDDNKTVSLLVDYAQTKDGKPYSITRDREEAKRDPSKIYVQLAESGNPTYEFTEEQMKSAKDVVKNGIRSRLDYEEKQVQNAFAPREPRAQAAGKKEAPKPTVNDIIYSSSVKNPNTGELLNQQKFIVQVPVVENSTKVPRSLKEMVFDPTNNHLRIVVDVPDTKNPNKITQVEFANYTRKKTIKGKLDKPDTVQNISPNISEINRFANIIFDESTGQPLRNQEDLMKWLRKKMVKQNVPTKAPVKNDVVDGYKFLGGDASDQKNWIKI